MKKYNLINNIFGWFCFAFAAVVYCLTIEPSASFWDCGEFITSAYKLEVGHPPGAPFFMLTGKFFTLFTSDVQQVAAMVNTMSAILSALTILFLFWTITHLAKKLICSDETKEMTLGQQIIIIGSGLVGALTYTFTDTFWFSAVEGEVYAYSSMFTALVFWLILKWENRADRPGSDKWLVLIAYAMGLSIGVHLLNLLCIPAIVLVYYYKKHNNPDAKGAILSLLGSFALIVVLMYGIIPGLPKVAGWFELLFVNTFEFSYNTGVLAYLILLLGALIWSMYETFSKKGNMGRAKVSFVLCLALTGVTFIGSNGIVWAVIIAMILYFLIKYKGVVTFRLLNTAVLCLFVVVIGYSSFALIPIRSAANPPMDQNSPEDVFTLASYLNREQYGDSPLFYGRTFASTSTTIEGSYRSKKFSRVIKEHPNERDRYVVESMVPKVKYTNTMLFPRMHADKGQPNFDLYMRGYMNWGGVTNPSVPPTFFQNLRFFFSYQLDYMYWRYFMWNFSGRQNDIQGRGGIANGNWITGISFIDEHVLGLGPQDDLPPDIADNKGHNVFYMLPLILGILGILYQLLTKEKKGRQQFFITFMLFFMTGIAIVIYLNQKPYEPRERDYAYAGSFYAYCIWIGYGVAGIWHLLKKYIGEVPAAILSTIACLGIPVQMATQTWDDHDRSGRYVMRDVAMNYLKSCEENAIIFTNGDNDTFPLWYIQEVEGYRTDVRVCNLSYLQTDWYVDQMRRPAYESTPLPILWERRAYSGDRGSYAFVLSNRFIENIVNRDWEQQHQGMLGQMNRPNFAQLYDMEVYKDTIMLDKVMTNLRTLDIYVPKNPLVNSNSVIPGTKLQMNIDVDNVDWANLGTKPADKMVIDISNKDGYAIFRSDIMILEMLTNINNENWKRPIYYATTVGSDMYLGMHKNNFMLQGLSYRITPGVTPNRHAVDTEKTFDNMVNKFGYTGINDPNVYLDETNLRTCRTYRLMFIQLVGALIEEGKNEKAIKAIDKCMEVVPGTTVPLGGEVMFFVESYFDLGEIQKGWDLLHQIAGRSVKTLNWYNRLKRNQMLNAAEDMKQDINTLLGAAVLEQRFQNTKEHNQYLDILLSYVPLYYANGVVVYGNGGQMVNLGRHIILSLIEYPYLNMRSATGDSNAVDANIASLDKILNVWQKIDPDGYKEYGVAIKSEMELFRNRK